MLYYLWYLDRVVGVERTGVLAHPTDRRRETVILGDEAEQRVEDAIQGVYEVVSEDPPPPATEKPV